MRFFSSSQIRYLYQRSSWCYDEPWWDFLFHGENLTRDLVILVSNESPDDKITIYVSQ